MNEYCENTLVRDMAADILHDELGWQSVNAEHSEDLGRASQEHTILPKRLFPALRRLNPWATDDVLEDVLTKIESASLSTDLIVTNEKKHEMILHGVSVSVTEKGKTETRNVRLIDFDTPENNDFLAVRELWVKNQYHNRRADLVGFVNGLPLVFMEFKSDYVDVFNAYANNYSDYLKTIPRLFHFNELVILSNGTHAKVGSLGSTWEFFNEWKRMTEEEEDGQVELGFMLRHMCRKDVLLDIVENFILFDHQPDNIYKILARNHQFMGVNLAIENYKRRRELDGRLGVFWHTQGSGKSYTMVFLSRKILRKFHGSPTFLVITDREDLNKQISETFESTQTIVGKASSAVATSADNLVAKLKCNPSFIFTLIQKFNDTKAEILHPDHEIIVFSDEAHRTQYGFFAQNLERMLPDLNLFGFTGTPLLDEEESTKKRFGDYVSIYDFARAVKDGATVPLYYVNRSHLANLENPNIDKELLEAIDNEKYDNLSDDDRYALKENIAKQVYMLCSESRLRILAEDFVNHYLDNWQSGKAMVVSVQKLASVRMYLYVKEVWQKKIDEMKALVSQATDLQDKLDKQHKLQWMQETEMEVVISESQNEDVYFSKYGIDINAIRSAQYKRKNPLEKDFKSAKHPFRIVFVCAMWLTGFDVKSLATIYIDKPLKAHTLMQTIARANRVSVGKENGVVVDYIGIVEALGSALQSYGGRRGGVGASGGANEGKRGALPGLDALLAQTTAMLDELEVKVNDHAQSRMPGFSIAKFAEETNKETILKTIIKVSATLLVPETFQKEFRMMFAQIERNDQTLFVNHVERPYEARFKALNAIQRHVFGKVEHSADLTDLMVDIDKIVSDSIKTNEKSTDFDPIDISQIDFSAISRRFKKEAEQEVTIERLRKKIEKAIELMLNDNGNEARQEILQKYQEIIDEYNRRQDRATIEITFERLLKLTRDMNKEQRRTVAEGFDSEAQMAVFDLMNNKKLNKEQVDVLKNISKDIVDSVAAKISEIGIWREDQHKEAQVQIAIRDMLYNLPTSFSDDDLNNYQIVIYDYIYTHDDIGFGKPKIRRYGTNTGGLLAAAEI